MKVHADIFARSDVGSRPIYLWKSWRVSTTRVGGLAGRRFTPMSLEGHLSESTAEPGCQVL
jgi:hypothetical protein